MTNLKKNKIRFLTVAAAGFATLLSGCASVVNGDEEKILVYSKPEGAQCKIYQGGQIQNSFTTPYKISLPRSSELDLILNCAKPGYQLLAQSWDPEMSGAYAGNMGWFLGSVASLSVFIPGAGLFAGGAAYDAAHQKAYGYPKYIGVELHPLEKGSPEQALPENFQKPSAS